MKDYKETWTWWTRYVEPSGEATVGAANMNVRAPALLPSVCVDVSSRVWLVHARVGLRRMRAL